jgi:hypothetical protein
MLREPVFRIRKLVFFYTVLEKLQGKLWLKHRVGLLEMAAVITMGRNSGLKMLNKMIY